MKRLAAALAIALTAALWLPVVAQAEFGLSNVDLTFTNADGTTASQAGSHPFAMTTSFGVNYLEEGGKAFTDGRLKDAIVEQIAGFVGDTTAYPSCSTLDFLTHPFDAPNDCPIETAVGIVANSVTEVGGWFGSAIFNLTPPPGVLVRLGFDVLGTDVVIDATLKHSPPYSPVAGPHNIPQSLYVFASKLQLWGNPSDPLHKAFRGKCYFQNEVLPPAEEFEFKSKSGETCPAPARPKPFLTLPTRCSGQNLTSFAVDSWEHPGAYLADGEADLADPNWHTNAVRNPR